MLIKPSNRNAAPKYVFKRTRRRVSRSNGMLRMPAIPKLAIDSRKQSEHNVSQFMESLPWLREKSAAKEPQKNGAARGIVTPLIGLVSMHVVSLCRSKKVSPAKLVIVRN
jgi:hypothetical protein